MTVALIGVVLAASTGIIGASVVLLAGSNMGRQVVTLVRDGAPGPLSDPWIAGNAGTRLLRGRRVVLDLGAQRLAIVGETERGRP